MPRELSPSQQQKLAALVGQKGFAFANEQGAQGLKAFPSLASQYQLESSLGHVCTDRSCFLNTVVVDRRPAQTRE